MTSESTPARLAIAGEGEGGIIFSVIAASAVALLVLTTGPLLVGVYVTTLELSARSAGLLFSLEMFGFMVGAIAMFALLLRNRWQVVTAALAVMTGANVLCVFADAILLLAVCRCLSGFGAGILMTMTMLVIGRLRNPDAIYGLWTVGQLSLGAVGLLVFPVVMAAIGLPGFFAIIASLSAMLFATVRFYSPTAPAFGPPQGAVRKDAGPILGWVCLAGIFVYYAGQAAVWAYLERIGISWALQPDTVSLILFAGLLAGIVGASLAVLVSNRAGRVIPVTASLALSAVSIGILTISGDGTRFGLAVLLFNLAWYLFLPYGSAVIAEVDRNGKLLTGLAVVFPGSLAAGPAAAALLVRDGELVAPHFFGIGIDPNRSRLHAPGSAPANSADCHG